MNKAVTLSPCSSFEKIEYQAFTNKHLHKIEALNLLPAALKFNIDVVSRVFPFRTNPHVIDNLIDWEDAENDPMFRLTFPQKGMLDDASFDRIANLIKQNASEQEIHQVAMEVRASLNPHPAGQMQMNVPSYNGHSLPGSQHKYTQTVLFFPSQGQVCHAYCTFCFRWAQFVGDKELKFSSTDSEALFGYLESHKEVTDLLITGGNSLVMNADHLERYLEGLYREELSHIQTVRFGTKTLTFWPQRFVTDDDSDRILAAMERLVKAGKHVAVMAHFNHWRELESPTTKEAIRRIRATGAQIRAQSPLLSHINDDAATWSKMWNKQIQLGIIPYYMFVARDTGASRYFELPLARAWEIYQKAMGSVSGLARTARGPSMSGGPGKVEISGVSEIQGEKVFVLRFIQARNDD
ncbi:KamA family radical SAM protein [Pelagibaculum spongiae]|uniref:KamA family radical SAM protein n=1 Tax=Pelagibaculum spongiae TaxID=2080658 RepID=UPI001F4E2E96|nr:lysine 2,3-aminomutase [Pelagibaculum spongiae]